MDNVYKIQTPVLEVWSPCGLRNDHMVVEQLKQYFVIGYVPLQATIGSMQQVYAKIPT
jgi:hypothetical protein